MGLLPSMGWDKPFAYGPFAALTSLRLSLIPTALAAAQTALLSYVLWATQSAFAPPSPRRHLVLCLILAAGTAAPWFASTIMPDAFTPLVALGLLTAAGHLPRRHALPILLVTTFAITTHLSHLVLAASLIAALALSRRRIPWRAPASLAAALLFLLTTNVIGRGRLAISPYGSVFALARLIADGPARDYLARTCPNPAIALCAWRNQLTSDSDQFLWDPASPFWSDPLPLPEFAAQASAIVAGTLRTEPLQVLRSAYRNAAHELIRVDLGDTLGNDFLTDTIPPRLPALVPHCRADPLRNQPPKYWNARRPGGAPPPAPARHPDRRRLCLHHSSGHGSSPPKPPGRPRRPDPDRVSRQRLRHRRLVCRPRPLRGASHLDPHPASTVQFHPARTSASYPVTIAAVIAPGV